MVNPQCPNERVAFPKSSHPNKIFLIFIWWWCKIHHLRRQNDYVVGIRDSWPTNHAQDVWAKRSLWVRSLIYGMFDCGAGEQPDGRYPRDRLMGLAQIPLHPFVHQPSDKLHTTKVIFRCPTIKHSLPVTIFCDAVLRDQISACNSLPRNDSSKSRHTIRQKGNWVGRTEEALDYK